MRFNLHTHSLSENAINNGYLKGFMKTEKWFSLGIHPWYIPQSWKEILLQFEQIQELNAIGECGLDKISDTNWELQKEVFQAQIELAEKINKPLIIHCVKAYNECEQLLKKVKVPVVFHGFNKRISVLNQLLKNQKVYVSFGKAVFFPSLNETIENCPMNRMFLETDETEIEIEAMYRKVAEIKGVSLKNLEKQVLLNRKKVFDL
jgi:TatD DNase family protein